MTWIDEAERQWRDLLRVQSRIREHREAIFNALWDEMLRCVAAARGIERFTVLETSGNPERRVISIRDKTLAVRLDDYHIITNDSEYVRLIVEDDGVVHLHSSLGIRLEYSEVAELFMRPFLFPELYRAIEGEP